ncbi:MAG: LysM peptidoglycan-binding domain-containing protein [Alistipes sp.]|nr:LysM peptidoglycan-binding domain-containing protein [Alistipes sp.]
MRNRALFIASLLLLISIVARATEPSSVIVAVEGKNYYLHTVERGDTLYSLSKTYEVTTQDIMACNDGLTASSLKAGNKLLIPYKELTSSGKSSAEDKRFRIHIVAQGETLHAVARQYKISFATLVEDNPNVDAEHMSIGTELRIRRSEIGYATSGDIDKEQQKAEAKADVTAAESQESQEKQNEVVEVADTTDATQYEVKPGDTLYSIARQYGLSSRDVLNMNSLKSHRDIKVGMILNVGKLQSVEPTEPISAMDQSAVEQSAEEHTAIIDAQHAADEQHNIFMGEGYDGDVNPVDVEFPPLAMHHTLKVAMMLPFHVRDNKINPNYVDLYKGVLLAMEDLKEEGYAIELAVFDTRSSASNIADIVNYEPGFMDAQLIIGPVHEDELRHVLSHAEANEVPVVTPLADMEALHSPVLFQLQAEESHRYDKVEELFDGTREIVTIYAGSNDWDYAREISAKSGDAPRRGLNYLFDRESFFYERTAEGENGEEVLIEDLMRSETHKLFVVVASNETDVDRILTTLSSTKASIVGRGLTYGNYVVLGNRKWLNMKNIDRQSFFKNNVLFVVPYHAKRNDEKIRYFDGRYVEAYGTLPSMFSYRGYDAAMIFCRKMFTGIDSTISEERFCPLTTPYRFSFENGLYVNTEWTTEHYHSNFTIESN